MRFLFYLSILAFLSTSCEISTVRAPHLRNKKVEAVYLANIPCPDCKYIETFVELTKIQTYVVNRRYIGREDFIQFEDKGKFNWIKDGTIVHLLDFNGPSYYEVDGDRIYQLDSNLHRMTGPNAYDYIFNKDIYEGAGNFD